MSEHRKWTQECNQPVELLARLRAMPSSLNDALRTMEDAASFIERCGVHTASAPDPDDIAEALQLVRRAREVYEAEPVDEAWSEMESAYATLIVKAFERRAALALSSAYRACQLCGEVAPLRCGPSRFGAANGSKSDRRQTAEIAIGNAECAAQREITDAVLRGALVDNIAAAFI